MKSELEVVLVALGCMRSSCVPTLLDVQALGNDHCSGTSDLC